MSFTLLSKKINFEKECPAFFFCQYLGIKKSMYVYDKVVKTEYGGEIMSPKELLYIEDALGHEKFMKTQCLEVASKIQDSELKNYVTQLVNEHEQLFQQFLNLL